MTPQPLGQKANNNLFSYGRGFLTISSVKPKGLKYFVSRLKNSLKETFEQLLSMLGLVSDN